jgi:hypothetical protein
MCSAVAYNNGIRLCRGDVADDGGVMMVLINVYNVKYVNNGNMA